MNYKWEGWDKPITLVSEMALEFRIPKEYFRLYKPGIFKFNDGTTQGWTIDQIYDTNDTTLTKLSAYTDSTGQTFNFKLGNSQDLALAASGNPVVVLAGPNVTSIDFYLESPDLLNNQDWKNIKGYSLDAQRNYFSKCGDLGGYYIQMQVGMWDSGAKKMKIYGEYDAQAKQYIFHQIDVQKPYHLIWTADIFTDPNLQLRYLRLRFTQPNYTTQGSGECLPKGAWLVGNISPE